MKLIDILVMISKGELKEGTKIVWDGDIYEDELELYAYMYSGCLNEECKLIRSDHFTDVGKMATEKIEELDNYDWQEGDYDYQIEILYRKLNQVIRRLNNENISKP